MFLSKKKDLVGIDIGSSSVKLVQLKEQKGVFHLQNVGILPLPAEAIVDNSLMDSSSIVEAVKNLFKSLNIKAKEAVCSISGNSVIIRKISLPVMPVEELEDQIHWEAEQYIPFDINDVNIDFQILSADELDPSKMNVLLVASKKDIINDYLAVFNEAGIKLMVVDVDSFAVQNAFELNYDFDFEEVSALVNIGASIMNLNIVKGGISLFTRDVQIGGNLYNEEIQKQFGMNNEDAERTKISGDSPDKTRLKDIISRINDTLSLEMRRSLDFYNSTAGEGKISKVYLSGGGAKTTMLLDSVSQKLDLPVEILNPFLKIRYNEKEFDPEYLQEIGPLVTVAIGLATRRLGDK
ncbi:type IV pilus biogenesis protein PilM [Geotalea uraniireducens]|uniref:Type IV pilus assembly protein PilM n=1 Tax=Geotalea uraniireducens (strain Rf4) TaxID=351605 RepID=A5GEZ5_GEOUR|nr:type IV pilus assembly protein PilM [Geotalea uraniireducens]ABQ26000.1 type IV pilus assembly protein PilM [Geotalea uraniireducens Rf4]